MTRRVVVVDDDRGVRDSLEEALTGEGYEVTIVPNGLKLIAALQVDKPDLLVLDVMMSWISGFDLCRAMKGNVEYQDIPVLFVSGESSPAEIQHGMACGATDYMVRPFPLSTFIEKVALIAGPP